MQEKLTELTKEWMELERKTSEQRKKADSFYEKKLFELITEDYIERNSELVFEDVRYLIVSVGTSYEPIVLNIKLFNPEKVFFIFTEKSVCILNKVVELCGLLPGEYDKALVSETDPLDIYREIKNAYLKWHKPEKLYIDFTGGTKAMSASAAMAGALINVQLIYLGTSDYLSDFRKPRPGSEELIYIENPLAVFGDMEIQKATVLFDKAEFAGAKEKLELLKETLPDPELRSQMEFIYYLARSYEAWDALDFENAYENMKKLNGMLYRDRIHKNYVLINKRQQLKKQERVLETLKQIPEYILAKRNADILKDKEMTNALMFTLYQNGRTRESQEKYDMATLLFYRVLELIEQRRLAGYDLYVSGMDYINMKPDLQRTPEYNGLKPREMIETLKKKVVELRTQLFQRNISDYLADQVSLLDGFVILSALKDPITGGSEKEAVQFLRMIRSKVFLRNNSIFAHGLGPVKPDEYRKFSEFVTGLIRRHCEIEEIDFDSCDETFRWVKHGFMTSEEGRTGCHPSM